MQETNDQEMAARIKKAAKNKAKKARKRLKQPTTSRITFGGVDVVEFSLDLGMDTVPSIGSYPLGLGREMSSCHFDSVDAYESQRASLQSAFAGKKYSSLPVSEADRMILFHTSHDGHDANKDQLGKSHDKNRHELSDLNKELKHIRESRNRSVIHLEFIFDRINTLNRDALARKLK